MPKKNNCPVCRLPLQEGQSRFYFPQLPSWHEYSKYHGTVHIQCLEEMPEKYTISKTLADIYENFFGRESATPAIARIKNIIIKDCRKNRGCFEVYDFSDFAEFYVPVNALGELGNILPGQSLPLGVQKNQILHRKMDGKIMLEIRKPHFFVELDEISYEVLVNCLGAANANHIP